MMNGRETVIMAEWIPTARTSLSPNRAICIIIAHRVHHFSPQQHAGDPASFLFPLTIVLTGNQRLPERAAFEARLFCQFVAC